MTDPTTYVGSRSDRVRELYPKETLPSTRAPGHKVAVSQCGCISGARGVERGSVLEAGSRRGWAKSDN
eukprot:4784910-Prymnesium_polylepis.1